MSNYYERTGRLSPLNQLEYNFLRDLYLYLTRQENGDEFRMNLYNSYTRLINICYFPNLTSIDKKKVDIIHQQCLILLRREMLTNWSFIYLNRCDHYQKMVQVIELLKNWSLNPLYYGYASYKEFFEGIDFLRKQFNQYKIDMHADVGKWPRRFRKRFHRKEGKEKI